MNDGRVNELRVRTPEGVEFAFPLAGPATRFLAWLVDALIVISAVVLVSWIASVFAWISPDWVAAFFTIVFFVSWIGYSIVFEWVWRGQSVGKRLLRLRVIDETGLPLTVSQLVLRNLLRMVDGLPLFYLVGGATMLLNRRAQRLGDLAAGTIVVRQRRTREPDFRALFAGRYNSLRELPHLAARLRQQVPPALAAAALGALLRRDELEPAARVTVFAELATALRQLVSFPPEITASLPDEAHVRNVVEIVLSTSGPSAETPATPASTSAR